MNSRREFCVPVGSTGGGGKARSLPDLDLNEINKPTNGKTILFYRHSTSAAINWCKLRKNLKTLQPPSSAVAHELSQPPACHSGSRFILMTVIEKMFFVIGFASEWFGPCFSGG